MSWVQRISRLSQAEKEGIFRLLIPPCLYHLFGINPLSFCDDQGRQVVRFFCPRGERTCLVELKLPGIEDPVFSIQLSDTPDYTQIDWDFIIVNDPKAERFLTHIDQHGRDTLFGWATRNLVEEERAFKAGLYPGQVRRGMRLTGEVIQCLDFFCRVLGIKSVRLEALFYHNAITYERHGFSYFTRYAQMKRIHELFQPGGALYERLDGSTPFRDRGLANTVRGRSWAIHDGILLEVEDELLDEGWVSPVMYRMVDKPRGMVTYPDPVY